MELFNLYLYFTKAESVLNIKYLFSILNIRTTHLRFDMEKIANNESNKLILIAKILSMNLVRMYLFVIAIINQGLDTVSKEKSSAKKKKKKKI